MRPPTRLAGITLATVASLAIVVGLGSWLRDRRILHQIFGKWTAEQVSLLSDGVYEMQSTPPHFSWGQRRVRVDSISLTTNTARLAARKDSLPIVHAILRDCQLSGVRLLPLALGRGLDARQFGCNDVDIQVEVPAARSVPRPAAFRKERPFMVLTREIELPSKVPSIRVTGVMFPRTRLQLGQRRFSGARVDLSLLLEWRLREFDLDPEDPVAMRRPLFSEAFTVEADSVRFTPAPDIETSIGHITISVTDSTLELRDFAYGPTIPDDVRARGLTFRSDRIKASAGRVAYAGLDLTQLAEGNGLSMRKLEVDSATLDVLSDKRLRRAPRTVARLTPQEWIRELDRGVQIDTVVVRDGHVVYREMHPERSSPGVLTFDGINAVATNVRHEPGGTTLHEPMRIALTSRLMNEARLEVRFDVPLDAPDFALKVAGQVGPMDVTQMNGFMQRVAPVRVKSGKLDSIRFTIDVKNGMARGSVVPLYDDLSLDITGRGMGGVLGGTNVISSVARGIAEVAVNELGVHRANPGDGKEPRAGRVAHRFTAEETLPAFLWNGIRDGLVEVVKKRGTKKTE